MVEETESPENASYKEYIEKSRYLEELEEGLVIVSHHTKWGIAGFFLLLVLAAIWGWFGRLPMEVWGDGKFARDADILVVHGYFSKEDGDLISEGNDAYIALDEMSRYLYGTIKGQVTAVHDADDERALVIVNPVANSHTFSGYEWTIGGGPHKKIVEGTPCRMTIATGAVSPIAYVWMQWNRQHPSRTQ